MPWNSIPTRSPNDVLDAADLNLYLENLEWLHTPNVDSYEQPQGANITTASTNWASISADFELSLTTAGEHVLVIAQLVSRNAQYDIRVDGTRLGTAPDASGLGIFGESGSSVVDWAYPFFTILELAAGAHTFHLEWKATSGTATIYTSYRPRFMVRALHL